MVAVSLFVEGGGSKQLKIECRRAFHVLLERAGLVGRLPKVSLALSHNHAVSDRPRIRGIERVAVLDQLPTLLCHLLKELDLLIRSQLR